MNPLVAGMDAAECCTDAGGQESLPPQGNLLTGQSEATEETRQPGLVGLLPLPTQQAVGKIEG
jgi:hypothetical protein